MAYCLLPGMQQLHAGDRPLVSWLKRQDAKLLHGSFAYARFFLPPFNKGTLTANVLLDPGISLAESNRVGHWPGKG